MLEWAGFALAPSSKSARRSFAEINYYYTSEIDSTECFNGRPLSAAAGGP